MRIIEIKSCGLCPYRLVSRCYSSDSFEILSTWKCEATTGQPIIANYVEWNQEDKIKIPSFCPLKEI